MSNEIMKSIVGIVIAVLIGCASMSAGCLSPIFKEFKSEDNCTVVKLPRIVMWLARLGSSDPMVRKISSIKVLTTDQYDSDLASRIDDRAKELSAGVEPLIRVNDEGDKVTIWMEGNEKKIKSICVYVNESDHEVTLVEFNGKFSVDDIEALVSKAQNGNK